MMCQGTDLSCGCDMPEPIQIWTGDFSFTVHYPVFVTGQGEPFRFSHTTDAGSRGGHWEFPTLAEEEDCEETVE